MFELLKQARKLLRRQLKSFARNPAASGNEEQMISADEFRAACRERQGFVSMQVNWMASLLEALEGTGVSPVSPTLLDDLTEAKDAHPKLAKWLETLPGYYSGNRSIAKERLGYFTMAVKKMSA